MVPNLTDVAPVASIHLWWFRGEWEHQELNPALDTMRPLYLTYFCTFSTERAHLSSSAWPLVPKPSHFHKKLEKRGMEMFFSPVWGDPETKLDQFFYLFLKSERRCFKKRTQTLWTHEIHDYTVACDWLFPSSVNQMTISDLSLCFVSFGIWSRCYKQMFYL